ncbi:hypothetical protein VE04_06881 [Pseudogymnoascus sp. 24MN13]|nr:hypothetical protein VE04_06881 [Pseudogymnoascus sp. 24MN13]
MSFTSTRQGASASHSVPAQLVESRENGDVLPFNQVDAKQINGKPLPVAKSWAHLVAGGSVSHPLYPNFLSALLGSSRPTLRSPKILFSVHKVEGWRALFKGLGPNLVGVVPARSIDFSTYRNGKRIIADNFNHGEENSWVVLLAAATAGACEHGDESDLDG